MFSRHDKAPRLQIEEFEKRTKFESGIEPARPTQITVIFRNFVPTFRSSSELHKSRLLSPSLFVVFRTMTPFQQNKNKVNLISQSGDVVVRSYIRKKPKAHGSVNKQPPKRSPPPPTKKGPSMDVASFKTILNIQKENMKTAQELKNTRPDPVHELHKQQWSSFMKTAKKASRRTKRKLNAARRSTQRLEEEQLKKQWLYLFRKIELYEGKPTEAEKKQYRSWPHPLPNGAAEEAQRLKLEWEERMFPR